VNKLIHLHETSINRWLPQFTW